MTPFNHDLTYTTKVSKGKYHLLHVLKGLHGGRKVRGLCNASEGKGQISILHTFIRISLYSMSENTCIQSSRDSQKKSAIVERNFSQQAYQTINARKILLFSVQNDASLSLSYRR